MIGIDTNLVVRLLTADNKKQALTVASLIDENAIFISKSVLLETEWVLRACYEIKPKRIAESYEKLFGLRSVTIEDPGTMTNILELYKKGMDFADALHLLSSKKIKKFVSFDKKFINKANKLGFDHVSLPASETA